MNVDNAIMNVEWAGDLGGVRRTPLALRWPRSVASRAAGWCIVLAAFVLPWISAGDHALYPPDEGRYAVVAAHMADGGSWIVPELSGRAHLTKPPLFSWAQALCMRVLGHSELAARLPALLASMGVIGLTLAAGRWCGGARRGVLAVALLSVMPLHLVVGRLAITDAMLALWWSAALLAGWRAVETRRAGWAALMWLAIALGLMTKGPVALLPALTIVMWLALAGRARDLRLLHPLIGLPLACAPLALWAFAVSRIEPGAWELWRGQILGRLAGEHGANVHAQPFWFYAPVVLAGLFPASLMLPLPIVHRSCDDTARSLRSASPAALWAWAIIVPFGVLSIFSGKLMTYMLPLAMPMALLAAGTLDRWLDGAGRSEPASTETQRDPEFTGVLAITLCLAAAGAIALIILWSPANAPAAIAMLLMPIAGLFMWRHRESARLRAPAMFAALMSLNVAWTLGFEIEDDVMRPFGGGSILSAVNAAVPGDSAAIHIYGYRDNTLEFYGATPAIGLDDAGDIADAMGRHPRDFVLLADEENWQTLGERNPRTLDRLEQRAIIERGFNRRLVVLTPRGNAHHADAAE